MLAAIPIPKPDQADVKAVLDRHGEMKSERQLVEPQWRDIAQLFSPEEADMFDGNGRQNTFEDIFDGTGLAAMDAFEGGLATQLTSAANRWFAFGIEDQDRAKYQPVRQWLFATTSLVLASCQTGVSNFYVEAPTWFGSIGRYGLGTLYQEEMVGRQRILDRVIPLAESYISLDADGELDGFDREFKLKGRQAKAKYPEIDAGGFACGDTADYTFVHAVQRNPAFAPGAFGARGMEWLSVTVSPELRNFMRVKGYREMPYHVAPWARRPGRTYPVGPGHRALPDQRMLNEMERSHIIAAQHAAEPMLLLHDDSALTAADIAPNRVLHGAVNEDGKPMAQWLTKGEDVRLSMDMSNQRRQSIKDATFFSILSVLNRPQMTATEFTGWQNQQLQLMGPNLARIESKGLTPFIARRFRILDRAGQIPPPPPELNGVRVGIQYTSQLAQLQKAAPGNAVLRYFGALEQMATTNPQVMDNFDADAAADVLLDAFGPPPSVRRDPRDVQTIRQTRAKQQAQQAQLDAAQQAANATATVAHAQQAGSVAQGRMQ